jgi:hypothetical protein
MSLQTELDAYKATWTERVGPAVARMMADDNAALLPQAARALKVGDRFPPLSLPDQLGRPIDLATLAAEGPLVVTFYRGGWCPYCNLELRAYQKALPAARLHAILVAQRLASQVHAPDRAMNAASILQPSLPGG